MIDRYDEELPKHCPVDVSLRINEQWGLNFLSSDNSGNACLYWHYNVVDVNDICEFNDLHLIPCWLKNSLFAY